jgi:citrate synthase
MVDSKIASKGGLEGVVAADSSIGKVDGVKGELRYCGYLITELADQSTFTETTWLLWHRELPGKLEFEGFRQQMKADRALPPSILDLLRIVAPQLGPMDALRTVVSALCTVDVPGDDIDEVANLKRATQLTARFPTIIAAYERMRTGNEPIAPRKDLTHAGNFLYMLNGTEPSPEVENMLDTCLVLHAEHGFNASTFSARVTAGTLADMYSAITSAIGTLKGPLHGGANTAVMNMLLGIDSVNDVETHIEQLLTTGQKVMGFGHRVYKVVDPRALILKEFSRRMAGETGESKWFEMSEKIEQFMKARKGIDMNVDFYSASAYYYMGIQPDLFTAIFAMSRIAGWCAHVMEQYANNRLIRPMANWIGPDPRDYVPLDQRS